MLWKCGASPRGGHEEGVSIAFVGNNEHMIFSDLHMYLSRLQASC